MANNKKITQLNPLSITDSNDVFAIVDVSAFETKKITRLDLMASPGPIGSVNPDTAVFSTLTMGGVPITEFSTDETLAADSDIIIPTQRAIKTYIDSALSEFDDAIELSVRHVDIDTTATIGEIVLVSTASGDVNIELIPSTKVGKIAIYKKNPPDSNIITITAQSSLIDDLSISKELSFQTSSLEFLFDGTNFYTI